MILETLLTFKNFTFLEYEIPEIVCGIMYISSFNTEIEGYIFENTFFQFFS